MILGYGNSSLPVIQGSSTVQWLTRLINTLRLSNFVIISPSMSGRFALPYVIQSDAKTQTLRGFVPIAPVDSESFTVADYKHVTVRKLSTIEYRMRSIILSLSSRFQS